VRAARPLVRVDVGDRARIESETGLDENAQRVAERPPFEPGARFDARLERLGETNGYRWRTHLSDAKATTATP
jgi:hypothetical protein